MLTLILAHRVAAHAFGGGLVLLARERLDLDANAIEKWLHVVRLRREAKERNRRLWGHVDFLGRRGDIELPVTAAAGEKHRGAFAFILQPEDLLAEADANRPPGLKGGQHERDPFDAGIADRIISKPANGGQRRGAPQRAGVENPAQPGQRLTGLNKAWFEACDDPSTLGSR